MTEERSLSTQLAERDVSNPVWHTLSKSLYPGAKPASVLMVIDYCRARGLDPLKKPAHIVPMKVKDAQTGNEEWRDVILPGIYEIRTTAQRTGEYVGHTPPEFGEEEDFGGLMAPKWCSLTVQRWNDAAGRIAEFPARVYFREACGTKWENNKQVPNARWSKAPYQMLEKCTEAAALRKAFPDELGGQMSAEEMDGQHHTIIDAEPKETDADALNRELDLQAKAEEESMMPEPE